MNIALWVLQVLLAAAFLAHGLLFLVPPPEVAVQMNAFLPRWFQLFLGVAEVLAAVGLPLPGLTRILPGLVPAAAAGVMVVTVSATVLHFVAQRVQLGRHHLCVVSDRDLRCQRPMAASSHCSALSRRADSVWARITWPLPFPGIAGSEKTA